MKICSISFAKNFPDINTVPHIISDIYEQRLTQRTSKSAFT